MILLCILFIIGGIFSIVFPKYSSFFYGYNINTRKFENLHQVKTKMDILIARITGVIFVLGGIFFLLGSCAAEKYK